MFRANSVHLWSSGAFIDMARRWKDGGMVTNAQGRVWEALGREAKADDRRLRYTMRATFAGDACLSPNEFGVGSCVVKARCYTSNDAKTVL